VAFLHSDDDKVDVADRMIPRLDAKEVAAVFSAPFHNFLRDVDEVPEGARAPPGKPTDWYSGSWTEWHEGRWRMHHFYVPINNQVVTKPKTREGGQASIAETTEEEDEPGLVRYKVWGMTARILVDAARVAYGEEPSFEVSAAPLRSRVK
jgi:coenzyme A diphosphatase NUDT7